MARYRVVEIEGRRYISLEGVESALDEVEAAVRALKRPEGESPQFTMQGASIVIDSLRTLIRKAGVAPLTENIGGGWRFW